MPRGTSPWNSLADLVHEEHCLRLDVKFEERLIPRPFKHRRRPKTVIISHAAQRAIAARERRESMMPRKLDDTARDEIEAIARQRASIPSDNDLAQKHKVSRSLIQHVMRLARRKVQSIDPQLSSLQESGA